MNSAVALRADVSEAVSCKLSDMFKQALDGEAGDLVLLSSLDQVKRLENLHLKGAKMF